MTDNRRTTREVRNQINRAYTKCLKAEGSNGLRRVNAQIADYLRDAAMAYPSGIVAYPQWSVTASDMVAAINASDHSQYEDLGTDYEGQSQGSFHSDESIVSALRQLNQ